MENEKQTKKKSQRTTQEQLAVYVEFVAAHEEMSTGRNNPRSPNCMKELWEQLAVLLNSKRGPKKNVAEWKESLAHWKVMVRARARKITLEHRATGGGPQTKQLSELEERALAVFGKSAVYGHSDVHKLGFNEIPPSPNSPRTENAPSPAMADESDSAPVDSTFPIDVDAAGSMPASRSNFDPPRKRQRRENADEEALNLLRDSMERRERLDERAIQAQVDTANALKEMAAAILALSQAVANKK